MYPTLDDSKLCRLTSQKFESESEEPCKNVYLNLYLYLSVKWDCFWSHVIFEATHVMNFTRGRQNQIEGVIKSIFFYLTVKRKRMASRVSGVQLALCTRLCRYSSPKRGCRRVQPVGNAFVLASLVRNSRTVVPSKCFLLLPWRSFFFSFHLLRP